MIDTKLLNDMINKIPQDKKVVLVNIGTPKEIYDCFAPLAGELLEQRNLNIEFYGTLNTPLHALNLHEIADILNNKNDEYFIIGVDSAIAASDNSVGKIYLRQNPLRPGASVGKKLMPIGTYCIVASTYRPKSDNPKYWIRNTSLSDVYRMAENFVDTIEEYLKIKEGELVENK